MLITDMPSRRVPICSGLFKAKPRSAIVMPVLFEGQVKAVIELASVGNFTDLQLSFLDQLTTGSASCSTRSRRRCRPRAC